MPGGNTGNGFDKRPQDINKKGAPPRDWTWASILEQAAEQELKGKTKKEWIADSLVNQAIKGNVAAIKEFGDRRDGKAKQAVEHTGENGGPIEQSLTVKFE